MTTWLWDIIVFFCFCFSIYIFIFIRKKGFGIKHNIIRSCGLVLHDPGICQLCFVKSLKKSIFMYYSYIQADTWKFGVEL